MPPLLRLLARQPGLLADHAEAYVDLLVEETGSASAAWTRRVWLAALGVCGLAVASVLAGVAVMLWAVTPLIGSGASWALVATPLVPLILALWSLREARVAVAGPAFGATRQQLKLDIDLLRETRPSSAP